MSLFKNSLFAICALILASSQAEAHSIFKKAFEKAYPTMKVSCNACHIKGEPKTKHSEFGELFHKELKAEKVTENWKAAKKEGGKEAQKAYEKETMLPLFEKALKKIQESKVPEVEGEENPNAGKTYDELIKAEKIDDIKIDPKKVEKLAAEKAVGDAPVVEE
ncbi:hypothetical protein OAG71_01300 [bacterium]|nr:hypothetical protein [bacterium]